MKSLVTRSFPAVIAVGLLFNATQAGAQTPHPGMPAAPLAGGYPAMEGGGQYMDASGRPIVLPASYCEPGMGGGYCPEGGYGACGPGEGYADFGGYSMPDQCGPHYFDVAIQTVFLKGEDLFEDVQPFGAIGADGPDEAPRILDPQNSFDEYEAGWQIAARYDIGPLSVLEGTYMGIYDIGFTESVTASQVSPFIPFGLTTVFSDYGVNIDPTLGLDQGETYTLNYQSDLQSTEFSYRRYWVGNNPRISGTYLAGARYIRMTEELTFSALALDELSEPVNTSLLWDSENDMVGFQFGGDAWIQLRQGLRIGNETKVGIYNNRYRFRRLVNTANEAFNFDISTKDDQIAFAGESSLDMVADILPSFSIRAGYRALYMNSLVTAGNNVNPDITTTALLTQADAVYHGFQAGLEYIY